jgi:pyrroline-5-carboxylate reductase
MPNTPSLIQLGASGLFANKQTSSTQKEHAETILSAVGITVWTKNEDDIDIITALSGSGPAYYFLFIETMINAAVTLGLDHDTAEKLAIQTALGASSMAHSSNVDVATLRRRVTSPKGTTEKAINSFQEQNLQKVVHNALSCAQQRAIEMANELKS